MVAYCLDCKRYVNQYCAVCSGNFGISVCERFGCGGKMLCPICGGNNLSSKREEVGSAYDFAQQRRLGQNRKAASDLEARYFAEQREKDSAQIQTGGQRHCPLCGLRLETTWKFCPECGVSLLHK
jgi:hypothetical protein